jgi:hypothetical protein
MLPGPPPSVATDRPRFDAFNRVLAQARDPRRRALLFAIGVGSVFVIILVIALATRSSAADAPPAVVKMSVAKPPPSTSPAPATVPTPTPAAAVVAPTTPAAPAAAPTAASEDKPTEATDGIPSVGAGPCRLVVTSTPAGSVVALDGEAAGPTPIAIAGPCQHRHVELSHPRYANATRDLTLAANQSNALDIVLKRPMHKLMVETTPSGAAISIGGHNAGTSPTMLDVLGFTSLAITVAKPGYAPATTTVYSKVASDHVKVQLTRRAAR